jgi:hypothetical protein
MAHSSQMGQLAEVRFGDVGRALNRYRPVLLAVVVIAAVAVALPDRSIDQADLASQWDPNDPAARTDDRAPAPDRAGADAENGTDGSPDEPPPAADLDDRPLFSDGGGGFDAAPSAGGSFGPRPDDGDRGTGDDGFAMPAPRPAPTGTSGEAAALHVSAALWVTRTAGTPLAEQGVPEGSLPVGTRAGGHDKASFIRVEGSGSELILTEDGEGARAPQPTGEADVQACVILDANWDEGEGASFDDAPDYGDTCVKGRSEGGSWVFDLSRLGAGARSAGVALVPGPDAPLDFQVAFARG